MFTMNSNAKAPKWRPSSGPNQPYQAAQRLPPGGSSCSLRCGWSVPPAGDSFRHPPRQMPPPSGREALCMLILQCQTSFFDSQKRLHPMQDGAASVYIFHYALRIMNSAFLFTHSAFSPRSPAAQIHRSARRRRTSLPGASRPDTRRESGFPGRSGGRRRRASAGYVPGGRGSSSA